MMSAVKMDPGRGLVYGLVCVDLELSLIHIFSGLEKDSGFQLTLPLIEKVLGAVFYGDMLMLLSIQLRPYEAVSYTHLEQRFGGDAEIALQRGGFGVDDHRGALLSRSGAPPFCGGARRMRRYKA